MCEHPTEIYNTASAARHLGLATVTIQKHIRTGKLPAVKHGRDWLIWRDDLEQFAARRRGPGRPRMI